MKNNKTNEEWIEELKDLDPLYNEFAEGCGLEDVGITDRYRACEYGYERGVIATKEMLIDHFQVILESKDQQHLEAIKKIS